MATNNALNNKSQELTIDPGASGDSFVQFGINTTGEFRIGVDDTDDSFRISQGSALGTSDTFVMTDAGERTMPLQPALLTYIPSSILNVTGDSTKYTIIWSTEIFDQNSDFNTGTGTFTSSVTGRFRIELGTWFQGILSSHTSSSIEIVTSNRTYYGGTINVGIASTGGAYQLVQSVLADMDAADTFTTTITVSNGTKVIDVWSVGASPRGYLNVSLIC